MVQKVRIEANPLQAYNLTVNDHHTYFVKGAEDGYGVWVHNACHSVIGELDRPATELKKTTIKSQQWNDAVKWAKETDFSKKGTGYQVRVQTKSEADKLLKEMMGNMNRYKRDAHHDISYPKGYEVHQRIERGKYDLYHIKWYNGNARGHIFYEIPH